MIMRTGLALGILVGLVGCGESGGGYSAFINAEENATNAVCKCFEAFEFPSEAACLAEFGASEQTPEEVACLDDAFNEYKDDVKPTIDCQMDALGAATRCVNNVNACDPEAVQVCFATAGEAIGECPEVSVSAEAAFDACFL